MLLPYLHSPSRARNTPSRGGLEQQSQRQLHTEGCEPRPTIGKITPSQRTLYPVVVSFPVCLQEPAPTSSGRWGAGHADSWQESEHSQPSLPARIIRVAPIRRGPSLTNELGRWQLPSQSETLPLR